MQFSINKLKITGYKYDNILVYINTNAIVGKELLLRVYSLNNSCKGML